MWTIDQLYIELGSKQNKFLLKTGKNGEKHKNQQTIRRQVLAYLKKMWICLVFINSSNTDHQKLGTVLEKSVSQNEVIKK